ncbi:TVP38/TMEM64 family protein [Streptomyces sp. NPDC059575]|uniref:TVP38/TMEM64 family protein n=1 Tax=Streptomyces sp. NPDC059575 TaxID=3346872 RepID=UPI0036BAFC42
MPAATNRSGGTAMATPRATVAESTLVVSESALVVSEAALVVSEPALAVSEPALVRRGLAARGAAVLLSPYARLALLLLLLAGGAACVLAFAPQQLLTRQLPPGFSGLAAATVFAAGYGLCTVAFVPRPLLNLAAGALFGSPLGLTSALAGTVFGAGLAFVLGRALGQDALRPLLRGRWLRAADGQLSRHGFRSMLAARLFPGVPFWAANYCAAVSRMRLTPFLLATALGSVPNTAAYAVAGARASAPTSPAFLIAMACIAVPALAGTWVAWRKRHHLKAG